MLFGLLVFFADPFAIFNQNKLFSYESKSSISGKINYQLWKLSKFNNSPSSHILLGDSRMAGVNEDTISLATNKKYINMAYGGGSMPEAISTFWHCSKVTKLESVTWGINIDGYNKIKALNRNIEAEKVLKNPLRYIVNMSTLQSGVLLTKEKLSGEKEEIERPNTTPEKFWRLQMTQLIPQQLEKYEYPDNYYKELKEIKAFCDSSKIELTFVVFPSHDDVYDWLDKNNRTKDVDRMLKDLEGFGPVINFHKRNSETAIRENFRDPVHAQGAFKKKQIAKGKMMA